MHGDFSVPGYEILEVLGARGPGQTWLSRESRSGELVVLQRLPHRADASERDRLLQEAKALADFQHEHIRRLRDGLIVHDALVLVLDDAAGGTLARLLEIRGSMTPGEVVTTAAPLAQALAELHRRGVVYGEVTAKNVLYTRDGRPLLDYPGMTQLLREVPPSTRWPDPVSPLGARDDPPTPASDVHGLAALCHAAIAGAHLGDRPLLPYGALALVAVVEAGLQPDPERRPRAADFARMLLDTCPATPVRLVGAVPGRPVGAVPSRPIDAVDSMAPVRRNCAPRHRKTDHRPSLPAVLVVAAVVLGAIFLGAIWWA